MEVPEHTSQSIEVSDNVTEFDARIVIPVQIENDDAGAGCTSEMSILLRPNYDNLFVNQIDQDNNNEHSVQAEDN